MENLFTKKKDNVVLVIIAKMSINGEWIKNCCTLTGSCMEVLNHYTAHLKLM